MKSRDVAAVASGGHVPGGQHTEPGPALPHLGGPMPHASALPGMPSSFTVPFSGGSLPSRRRRGPVAVALVEAPAPRRLAVRHSRAVLAGLRPCRPRGPGGAAAGRRGRPSCDILSGKTPPAGGGVSMRRIMRPWQGRGKGSRLPVANRLRLFGTPDTAPCKWPGMPCRKPGATACQPPSLAGDARPFRTAQQTAMTQAPQYRL